MSADGVVVGQGFHERAGEPHAEVHALDEAGARARGAHAVLHARAVLPLGPHRARASTRIVEAGIARVVAAVEDPNPLVQRPRLRVSARARRRGRGRARRAAAASR